MVINSRDKARQFAMSVMTLGSELQDALTAARWEEASDTLDSLEGDIERLREYVNAKLEAQDAEK